MIINGYDTTVGSRYRLKDKVTETIKTLQTTNVLEKINTKGVFAVDHKNDFGLPQFIYPISITNYLKEKTTVLDQRIYFNKLGRCINLPEYNLILLAACLQQDLQNGNTNLIKSSRPYTLKAFANCITDRISKNSKLDVSQRIKLSIILGHYFVCLLEDPNTDFTFVSQNAIVKALRYDASTVNDIIKDLGYVNNVIDLVDIIKNEPSLYPLAKLDVPSFISMASSIFFSTSGFRQLMGGAIELPSLFTAICWGGVTQKIYFSTDIGRELDVRNNSNIDSFIKSVDFYFNN
jgi:hypothetical protein